MWPPEPNTLYYEGAGEKGASALAGGFGETSWRVHPSDAGARIYRRQRRLRRGFGAQVPGASMLKRILILAVGLTAAASATPSAQSDLDALMSRVLERRDENWKKLQQYTLNERETLQITALGAFRVYGFERAYLWFPRAGYFIRSPLSADGVYIDEEERRREEDRWLKGAERREKRQAERANRKPGEEEEAERQTTPGDVILTGAVEDVILQSFEPGFIRSANFLRFKFDQGQYAMVGRDRMLDREVLKIEYYPKLLFKETRADRPCDPRGKPDRCDKDEDFEEDFEARMNKVSLVTLWIDPKERQILRYEFRIQDMDFLPGRSLVRVDGTRATMQMAEPFPNVWLPASVAMRFRVTSAAGPLEARYDVTYRDYRLPTVTGRVR
jgi:hypothetical protein